MCLSVAGCATTDGSREFLSEAPQVAQVTPTGSKLGYLPPPEQTVDVAIYSFPDLTGQHKPNSEFTEYSRAVTQGGLAFAVSALHDAGAGQWFNVMERSGLQDLLQERQIISTTRQQVEGTGAGTLPALRFAGIIIEGGIVGYDANTLTGGIGARYLGIGANTQYRRDSVTVSLRAVSVSSGRILESVTTTKTIYSMGIQGSAFNYVATDEILEAEAGVTRNEPNTLAVREAIELAVYCLIVEGAEGGHWSFQDSQAGAAIIADYRNRSPRNAGAPQMAKAGT